MFRFFLSCPTVGLWVESCSRHLVELCSMDEGKPGPPVRYHVYRQSVEAKDMLHQQLSRQFGQGKLVERTKVGHFAEPVDDDEHD